MMVLIGNMTVGGDYCYLFDMANFNLNKSKYLIICSLQKELA